ncbi:PspC domain-containing protein [Acetobacteraceae bacterium KSS8]|uniref:PspC domain-containing protein n=1 Tax=Endosaccharibacter trunci TaxID=2812733 RepID=A0ABT1W3E4_9PROT|nr:PspC domain-containing protein [Acetobacteraceae bacterium KSS8]
MNGFGEPPRLWRHDDGAIFAGVCAGLAEDLDLPLPLVRLVALVFVVLPTGLAYLALGILLRRRPGAAAVFAERAFMARDSGPARSGPRAPAGASALPPRQEWALLQHRLLALEPRITRIEGVVTAEDFELQRDFRRMGP